MPQELFPLAVADWAKNNMWPKPGQLYLVFLEMAFKIQEVSQI